MKTYIVRFQGTPHTLSAAPSPELLQAESVGVARELVERLAAGDGLAVSDVHAYKPDACLIAAAPFLLEAIYGIAGLCKYGERNGNFLADIEKITQTAIAMVTNEKETSGRN